MDANKINNLAMDQAIIADANETPIDAETAVQINAASLHTKEARRRFKQDFRRHMRNIAEGNQFYK